MSHLTADIICRTVFSTSLRSQTARDVFEAFTVFERQVAHVELKRLIFAAPFARIPQHAWVLDACSRIRRHLGDLVDTHRGPDGAGRTDIAADVIAARDHDTGQPFSRDELIDQLGVFFLAGHETTASVLTWTFFILATQPDVVARMRAEIDTVVGQGAVGFDHIRRLHHVRNVFRETLRLYPPLTFIPRVATELCQDRPICGQAGRHDHDRTLGPASARGALARTAPLRPRPVHAGARSRDQVRAPTSPSASARGPALALASRKPKAR